MRLLLMACALTATTVLGVSSPTAAVAVPPAVLVGPVRPPIPEGSAQDGLAEAAVTRSTAAGEVVSAAAPTGVAGTWHQIFGDEFNGTSLNKAKWSTGWFSSGVTRAVNSRELACYDPANVTETGGHLALALTRKNSYCSGATRAYAGSLVSTRGKFTFTYGYIEARMYLPGGSSVANWPAFWADGTGAWPYTGELDVMEGLNTRACGHFHSTAGGPGVCAAGNYAGWHTFGANWVKGKVTYYYDGRNIGSITLGITGSPMYLILDNTTSDTPYPQTPATVQVDYVRAWRY